MPSISVQVSAIEHGDDEDRTVQLPAEWAICSHCRGNGGHSRRFGAITQRDREEWDDESFEAYMRGDYDETCEVCEGSGKVLVVNRSACHSEEQKAALAQYDEDARLDAEDAAMRDAEMRYCYGPNY